LIDGIERELSDGLFRHFSTPFWTYSLRQLGAVL